MTRGSKSIGQPMLVKLPETGYEGTGEGGLAFFFIVKHISSKKRRQACMAGDILWPLQDCQISPRSWPHFLEEHTYDKLCVEPIDAGLLIGSTGQSLWSDTKESYFIPKLSDLTPEGERLYHTLKRLYGSVVIVTLLDT